MKHQAQFKQWFSPVSSAAALALLMAAGNAAALGLGSIHVRSNLGEVFSAEVDINAITAAEAEDLRVNLADAAAYEAAGLEMSTALQGASVTLEKSADGRSYLRIRGNKPVNDPFIDLLIQTDNVQSGRATRGYTVLIDPPAGLVKAPKIAPPVLPVVTQAPRVKAEPMRDASAAVTAEPSLAPTPAPAPKATSAARPAAVDQTEGSLRVERGATAGAIARQLAAQQSVSYDQMLAALLRQNPDAFIGGNVNRIKAGAVLQTPSAEQATSVSQQEAKRQWMASGNNFKQYRRRLAQMDGAMVDGSAGRSSSGSVTGEATEQGGSATARDKLTLGKAARSGRNSAEEQAVRKRHRAESSARQAELSKNIEELKKLSGVAEQPAATANPKKNAAGVSVPAPLLSAETQAHKAAPTSAPTMAATFTAQPAAAGVTEPIAAASAAEGLASAAEGFASAPQDAASAASLSASAPVDAQVSTPEPTPVPKAAPAVSDPMAESSWMDKLSEWALPLGGLLGAAALGGFAWLWLRRRQQQAEGAVDSAAFLESKLEADSFFDASGGQRIDTSSHTSGISSSMVYSPSQLDAAGDVDPVAEAGVYMAYNRYEQAEDILKEAMRVTPSRVAIYTTLMEIYAKRGDLKAFDVVAREAHHLTGGQGDEWAKALELGRQTDPSNPMFASHADAPAAEDGAGHAPVFERPAAAATAPMSLEQAQEAAKIEAGDLDMVFRNSDFKLSQSHEPSASMPAHLETTPMQMESAAATAGAAADLSADAPTSHMDLSFDLDIPDVSAGNSQPAATGDIQFTEAALSGQAPLTADEPLKFDMSDLSLDLSDSTAATAAEATAPVEGGDPWLTKLELAREFVALGDSDGARAMAEEIIANAPADVADKARAFIATMV